MVALTIAHELGHQYFGDIVTVSKLNSDQISNIFIKEVHQMIQVGLVGQYLAE